MIDKEIALKVQLLGEVKQHELYDFFCKVSMRDFHAFMSYTKDNFVVSGTVFSDLLIYSIPSCKVAISFRVLKNSRREYYINPFAVGYCKGLSEVSA